MKILILLMVLVTLSACAGTTRTCFMVANQNVCISADTDSPE